MSDRRLLIVSSHFPPDRSAGTHRVLRLANQLQSDGWTTTVLTLAPAHYRRSIQTDEALGDRVRPDLTIVRTGAWRGLSTVLRVRNRLTTRGQDPSPATGRSRPSQPARGWRAWRRKAAVGLFGFPDDEVGWLAPAVFEGLRLVRRERIDVVLTSAPPFTCHLVGHALRSLCQVRWVADFRDPWARAPWGRSGSARAHQWLEAGVIARADAVILNTPELHHDFAQHYGAETSRKFFVASNGYDAELLEPFARMLPAPAPPLVLTHAGNLYGARDPLPLLEGLAACRREGLVPKDGIRLALVGKIASNFDVSRAIERLGLADAVTVTPPVPHETSLRLLAGSHVLVVIQPDTALQVPAKLYEYIGLRRPILALAGEGAVARVIREGDFGVVVAPTDVAGLTQALARLYRERDTLVDAAVRNASVEQFDAARQSRFVSEIVDRCTSSTWFSTSIRPTIRADRGRTSSPGAGPPRDIG